MNKVIVSFFYFYKMTDIAFNEASIKRILKKITPKTTNNISQRTRPKHVPKTNFKNTYKTAQKRRSFKFC